MSRLVVFVETSQTLPPILFFTAIAYKQTRIIAVNETRTRILCLQARSEMLCAVDYIFNLLCAFNCLQPMKKFMFSVASRATGRLQIKPSGSGDENARPLDCARLAHAPTSSPGSSRFPICTFHGAFIRAPSLVYSFQNKDGGPLRSSVFEN